MSKQVVAFFFIHVFLGWTWLLDEAYTVGAITSQKKATVPVFRHDPRHAKGKAA